MLAAGKKLTRHEILQKAVKSGNVFQELNYLKQDDFVKRIEKMEPRAIQKIGGDGWRKLLLRRLEVREANSTRSVLNVYKTCKHELNGFELTRCVFVYLRQGMIGEANELLRVAEEKENIDSTIMEVYISYVHHYSKASKPELALEYLKKAENAGHALSTKGAAFSVLQRSYLDLSMFDRVLEVFLMKMKHVGCASYIDYAGVFQACTKLQACPKRWIRYFENDVLEVWEKDVHVPVLDYKMYYAMIGALTSHGSEETMSMAFEKLQKMREAIPVEKQTDLPYSKFIAACSSKGMVKLGNEVFMMLNNEKFGSLISTASVESMLHMHFKAQDIHAMLYIFDICWQRNIRLDINVYQKALHCASIHHSIDSCREIVGHLFNNFKEKDLNAECLHSAVMCLQHQPIDEVMQMIDAFSVRNVWPDLRTYTTTLNSCITQNEHEKAQSVLHLMRKNNIKLDLVAYNAIFFLFSRQGPSFEYLIPIAESMIDGDNVVPDIKFYRDLLDQVYQQHGVPGCQALFLKLRTIPKIKCDKRLYLNMIYVYLSANQPMPAIELFQELQCQGFKLPASSFFSRLISVCNTNEELSKAFAIRPEKLPHIDPKVVQKLKHHFAQHGSEEERKQYQDWIQG